VGEDGKRAEGCDARCERRQKDSGLRFPRPGGRSDGPLGDQWEETQEFKIPGKPITDTSGNGREAQGVTCGRGSRAGEKKKHPHRELGWRTRDAEQDGGGVTGRDQEEGSRLGAVTGKRKKGFITCYNTGYSPCSQQDPSGSRSVGLGLWETLKTLSPGRPTKKFYHCEA